MTRAPFYSDCVGWPRERLAALEYLVDNGEEVTLETFRRRTGVNPNPKILVRDWGATGSLRWVRPWGVTHWRLPGLPVYWYVESSIEHVYATAEAIDAVHALAAADARE